MSESFLVVLAGGSGTRFWPKSTQKRPKQLLSFSGGRGTEAELDSILLNQTLHRFDSWIPKENQIVLTTELLRGEIKKIVDPKVQILAEPAGRNTAPCIYWAARVIQQKNPKALMLVMPSDHYVPDLEAFTATVQEGVRWAESHSDLVTLGITPDRPETGYGYLKTGSTLNSQDTSKKNSGKQVLAFVEKPGLEKAQAFLKSGDYLWNGGMFLWRVDVILSEFDRLMPEMKKIWESSNGNVEQAYPQMTATSIDYGIMEKAQSVVTFPLQCGWDDLGSWTSLENLSKVIGTYDNSNVKGCSELVALESTGNIVDAPKKLVALLGVQDLIVVESGGAILVAHKSRAQDIRKVVEEVKGLRPDLT